MDEINELKPHRRPRRRSDKNIPGGLLLLLIGVFLLARQMGAPIPEWLFSWPMILIFVGLFVGFKQGFRNPGALILFFMGGLFLVDQMLPQVNLKPFIFPIILICLGVSFMLRPRHSGWRNCSHRPENNPSFDTTENSMAGDVTGDRSDFIDTTSVFGGIKKIVLSKNFKGGDITNIMGGSEINLTQADFKGRIHIDTTNVFGGTKLIVPSNWDVQSDVVAIFGGVDDKRQVNGTMPDPDKLVIIDGTCLFGGIEIRSY